MMPRMWNREPNLPGNRRTYTEIHKHGDVGSDMGRTQLGRELPEGVGRWCIRQIESARPGTIWLGSPTTPGDPVWRLGRGGARRPSLRFGIL